MLKLAPWKHPDLLAVPSLPAPATPLGLLFKLEFLFQVNNKKIKMLSSKSSFSQVRDGLWILPTTMCRGGLFDDGAHVIGLYEYCLVQKEGMMLTQALPCFL